MTREQRKAIREQKRIPNTEESRNRMTTSTERLHDRERRGDVPYETERESMNTILKGTEYENMHTILIVSKTKMANDHVCVGGIDIDNKMSVRLLDIDGSYEYIDTCPFSVHELWGVKYKKHDDRPLPHSEDICVIDTIKLGVLESEIPMLYWLNKIQFHVYQGSILNAFENRLHCTPNGSLYISEGSVPNNSTCFWICDRDIIRNDYFEKIRYCYDNGTRKWGYKIPYVGLEENPTQKISRGTLVRLSLANWWSPEDSDTEERCYLQLSGWYE